MSGSTGQRDTDQLSSLKQAFDFFTSATNDFKVAYGQLEQRVAKLNFELEAKNNELEQSLSETRSLKQYLANILTSMDAGVISTDRKGEITLFNRAAEQLTGYDRADVLNRAYNEVFDCEGEEGFDPEAIIRAGQRIYSEKSIKCADGKRLPVKSNLQALQTETQEAIGIVEVFEDLSEMRRLEQEMHQIRTLSALGEMAGDVAHEIRNPLGAIAGFAALLERDLGADDPRQRLVRKIIEGVGKMDGIIGNLVFLARPVEPNMRKVDMTQLCREVMGHLGFQAREQGKDIDFQSQFPTRPVGLQADPQLLQQMLLHLIRNAIESIEQQGQIRIAVKTTRQNTVKLTIADTGSGIPDKIRERLYHPFATNKAKKAGLGLSIVRKIVDVHRGKISVDGSARTGTKIHLEFPRGQ